MTDKTQKDNVLNEIREGRVDSFDYGISSSRGTKRSSHRSRAATIDDGTWRSKTNGTHAQSFENQSECHEDELDRKIKYASLDPRIIRATAARRESEEQPDEVKHEGKLYKTSRGKITPNLKRDQHEHRQYRNFQLTGHSLEYSQTLQRVCKTVANYKYAYVAKLYSCSYSL